MAPWSPLSPFVAIKLQKDSLGGALEVEAACPCRQMYEEPLCCKPSPVLYDVPSFHSPCHWIGASIFTSAPNGMTTTLSSPCISEIKRVMQKKAMMENFCFKWITMLGMKYSVNLF